MKNQPRTHTVAPACGVWASPWFPLAVAVGCLHVGACLWFPAGPCGADQRGSGLGEGLSPVQPGIQHTSCFPRGGTVASSGFWFGRRVCRTCANQPQRPCLRAQRAGSPSGQLPAGSSVQVGIQEG